MVTIGFIQMIGMAGWHGSGNWVWWPLIPIFWLALAAFLILVVWRLSGPRHSAHSSAKLILAERYARGEIDVDEYRRRMDVLS